MFVKNGIPVVDVNTIYELSSALGSLLSPLENPYGNSRAKRKGKKLKFQNETVSRRKQSPYENFANKDNLLELMKKRKI